MKIRFPLYAQISVVFLFNILLLLTIYLFFFSSQFNSGWEAVLYSPVGDRIRSIAFVIDRQIRAIPAKEWNHVLAEFGEFYGVKFYLFDPKGHQLAGEPVILSPQVLQRVVDIPARFRHAPDVHEESKYLERDNSQLSSDNSRPGAELSEHEAQPSVEIGPSKVLPVPLPLNPFSFARPRGRFFVHTSNPDMIWIGAFIFSKRQFSRPGTLLAATPNLWQTRLIFDFGPLLLLWLGVFLLSLLVWWPFIYGITQALDRLTSTTEKIAEGKFETSLKMPRWDEIGRLAQAINIMSARLKMFVYGQRRFLGDIAHELCSPIARLQIAIALLEPSCNDEQSAAINDIREEVEQMSSLINELLAFSKAGISGKELKLVTVDLESLLQKISSVPTLVVTPKLEIHSPISCLGDELLLERAFGNILRNAERYAPNSGPILIKAERTENMIVIKFADNGPGVQPEALELLCEPFYRPESSRNRSYGGVGLGLAIVKTCIEACQGSVTLRNRQPTGLEVEVKLLASG